MALVLLHKYVFVDHNKGTHVVLAFDLLLQECWRAVKVEDDDENSPMFLQESLLGRERAEEVIEVIMEIIGKLPSQVTDKEMPEEFELGSSAEVEKATAEGEKIVNKGEKIVNGGKKKGKVEVGQKKPAARKCSVHSPSPA